MQAVLGSMERRHRLERPRRKTGLHNLVDKEGGGRGGGRGAREGPHC